MTVQVKQYPKPSRDQRERSFPNNPSRTDFLVAAVRTQLLTHTVTMQELFARQSSLVGAAIYGRKTLEQLVAKGMQLDINVVGLCMFSKDVTAQLAQAAVRSLKVRGTLRASPEVKAALRERMQ